MKNQLQLLLILLAVLFTSCRKSDTPQPDISPPTGTKISRLKAVLTPFNLGKPSPKDRFTWASQVFNEREELISSTTTVGETDLDSARSWDYTTTFKYENGKLIEREDPYSRYTFEYNGSDTTEIKLWKALGLYTTEKREYGANGKVSRSSTYDSRGSLFMLQVFSYDGNNITKDTFFEPFENSDQLIYTYDGKGNRLSETFFERVQNTRIPQAKFVYSDDGKNRLTESTRYDPFKPEYRRYKNFYNAEGRLLKQDLYSSASWDGPYNQVATIDYSYTFWD